MWLDDKGKKSKLSAPQYVDYVMTYVQKVSWCEMFFGSETKYFSNVKKNIFSGCQWRDDVPDQTREWVSGELRSYFEESAEASVPRRGSHLPLPLPRGKHIGLGLSPVLLSFIPLCLQIVLLGLHAHLNSIFAHIIEYNFFYHILEDKELEVLQVERKQHLLNLI